MLFGAFFTFLQQAQPGAPRSGSALQALIPFILIFVIFYLLFIMPQRKKQKKHQQMVEELKPGDKVVTTGGIYGTVMGVQKDRFELKVASNVKIEITKNAIGAVLTPQAPQTSEKKS